MYSEISESLKGLGCCTAMYLEILEALKRALKKYFARFYSPSGVFPVRYNMPLWTGGENILCHIADYLRHFLRLIDFYLFYWFFHGTAKIKYRINFEGYSGLSFSSSVPWYSLCSFSSILSMAHSTPLVWVCLNSVKLP